jgi:hypothetical protein
MAVTETMLLELPEQVLCTQNIDGISVCTALQQVRLWILADATLMYVKFLCSYLIKLFNMVKEL